jgi:hypothetical protein
MLQLVIHGQRNVTEKFQCLSFIEFPLNTPALGTLVSMLVTQLVLDERVSP